MGILNAFLPQDRVTQTNKTQRVHTPWDKVTVFNQLREYLDCVVLVPRLTKSVLLTRKSESELKGTFAIDSGFILGIISVYNNK